MQLRSVAHPRELKLLDGLFRECEVADGHHPLTEPLYIEVRRGPAIPELGVVAAAGDRIVGYAHVVRVERSGFWSLGVAVTPGHRPGPAADMIERVLTAAGRVAAADVILWVFDEWLARVAEEEGFEATRELRKLSVALPLGARPKLPAWVRLDTFHPGRDEDAWLEVNNAAFMGHPENGGWDRAVLGERLRLPWFEAAGLLMAWDDDRLAGFCWTKRHGDGVGEIYVIGVHPDYQGRGLGRALVVAGLNHLAEHDCRTGTLYVDVANTGGIGIYRSIGFQLERLDRSFVSKVPNR